MIRDTILVCGSRDWNDADTIRAFLAPLAPRPQDPNAIDRLVHGGARGADEIAGAVARELGFMVIAIHVDHVLDGPWPGAGHARNRRMWKSQGARWRCAFAFSERGQGELGLTKGTSGMARIVTADAVPITIVRPGARP